MLVDSSNSTAAAAVTGAIRQASQATGTSFHYLLATAKVESGLNPGAGAATSSARGLFQFIEQTWLGTLKESGAALGYGRYADAITKTGPGQYAVKDPAMRSEILKLRNDPTANAVMAGAFTKANADILASKLGRVPSEGELYIAHFLGAGGAARLISLAAGDPNGKAAAYFPNAASANPPIFYDRATGAARSLAQVRDILTARYDVAARMQAGTPVAVTQAATAPAASVAPLAAPASTTSASGKPAAAVPDTAGLTNAFAAAIPKAADHDPAVFHGLFRDSGDAATPVAAVVSQLWGVPDLTASPSGKSTPAGGLGNLFTDVQGT